MAPASPRAADRPRARGRRATAHARRDRQVVRLISILTLLLQDTRLTVYQLAARFRTRRETIYRDLRALQDVGIPIVGDESGHLSRPRLDPTYRLSLAPVPLTRREILALAWAIKRGAGSNRSERPWRPRSPSCRPCRRPAMVRPPWRWRRRSEVGAGVKDPTAVEATLPSLVQAITGQHRCSVEYQALGRSRPRRFPYDPYQVISVHGGFYCVGKVPAYRNPTVLAVERIRGLEVTTERFEVDPAIDLKRYEEEAFGVSWEKPMTIIVRFRADQARYVREREWHPTQTLRELRGGGVELRFRAGGWFEIRRWILGWGDAAEVVRPATLRREIASVLQRAAMIYGQRVAHARERGRLP